MTRCGLLLHIGLCGYIAITAKEMNDEGVQFSETALNELKVLRDLLDTILDYAKLTFVKRNLDAAYHIEPLEEVMDDLINTLHDNHLQRLRDGKCTIRAGISFLNVLTNLEQMSDACSHVGVAVVARIRPEKAGLSHEYLKDLHQGENTKFNEAYDKAHESYYKMLNEVESNAAD